MHLAFNTRALLKQSRSLSNFLAQAVRGCSEDYKITNCCNGTSIPYSRKESEVALFFRIEEFKCTRIERPWDHGSEKILSSITFDFPETGSTLVAVDLFPTHQFPFFVDLAPDSQRTTDFLSPPKIAEIDSRGKET